MTRKGRSITLSVNDNQKAQLERIALEFNITWGDNPNISQLVKAIADGKLRIAANNDWTTDRINALNKARAALVDAGEIEMALTLAHLLLERSELSIPLRTELEQFIDKPTQPLRLEVERYIRRQQPFQLSYQDAAERIWHFTIRYAEIAIHESRQYLDCWCEETEGNQDLSELAHNWCLRFDRIAEAAVAPIAGRWYQGLASIPVEMHLFRSLAFAYRSKTTWDETNEWSTELPHVRRVVRHVSNTFWFLREVLRYGQDCEVISPDSVRDRVKQEVQKLYQRYEGSE